MRSTYPVHAIFFDVNAVMIFVKEYNLDMV
jgi:hypothetical protein